MESRENLKKEDEVAFEIILHAGNAKSYSLDAVEEMRKNNIEESNKLFQMASDELTLAHNVQTEILRKSLFTPDYNVGMIMIHAQDHLMNAITISDLAKHIVSLYSEIRR